MLIISLFLLVIIIYLGRSWYFVMIYFCYDLLICKLIEPNSSNYYNIYMFYFHCIIM